MHCPLVIALSIFSQYVIWHPFKLCYYLHISSFQGYPVHELSSFVFFIFPMSILMILYIRMGLQIRQTSEIQRNLPAAPARNNSPPPQAPPRPLVTRNSQENGLASGLLSCASCKEVFVPLVAAEGGQAKTRSTLFACWGSREAATPRQPKAPVVAGEKSEGKLTKIESEHQL